MGRGLNPFSREGVFKKEALLMREIGPDVYQVPLFTRFWESVHFTQKNEQKLLLWEGGLTPSVGRGFARKDFW